MVDSKHINMSAAVIPRDAQEEKKKTIKKTITTHSTNATIDEKKRSNSLGTTVDAAVEQVKLISPTNGKSSRVRTRSLGAGRRRTVTDDWHIGSDSDSDTEASVTVYRKGSKRTPRLPPLQLHCAMIPMKVTSKDGVVKGSWTVPISGTVCFKFDNSFSKIRSKKVMFRAVVHSQKATSRKLTKQLTKRQSTHIVSVGNFNSTVAQIATMLKELSGSMSQLPMLGTILSIILVLLIQQVFSRIYIANE
mmetsp:Transcript_2015/g.3238  ORF Transcript_2015/g.3238 Transcript_2015/m.3238 type:complete len:248 (-) Transcript_2015:69-812(-)